MIDGEEATVLCLFHISETCGDMQATQKGNGKKKRTDDLDAQENSLSKSQ